MSRAPLAAVGIATCILATGLHADSIEIVADRDNTLFESGDGGLSSGSGRTFYAGRINFEEDGFVERRGILHFDLSDVPAGATIVSAAVRVEVTKVPPAPPTGLLFELHRCLSDWGEGSSSSFGGDGAPSSTNDATWLHGFYPGSTWAAPGGDFAPDASGSATLGLTGSYTFSGDGLASDVQSWVDGGDNNGWIMVGDVSEPRTVRQFASREAFNPAQRPTLIVEFDMSGDPADLNGDGSVNGGDLGLLLAAWGPCSGCPEDLNGDGVVNGGDLGLMLAAWN